MAFACLLAAIALIIPAQAHAASGVYGFVTAANDEGTEYNLVIKNGSDQPDADTYGVTIKDWSSEEFIGSEGVAINLRNSEYEQTPDKGGVYAYDSKSDGYIAGFQGLMYPWRLDEDVRTKIVKVIVPLDDSGYVSGLDCETLFAGLVNCKEFDLVGLDTTGNEGYWSYADNTPNHNSDSFPDGMFGFYDLQVSTDDGKLPCGTRVAGHMRSSAANTEMGANAKCKSVEKIITGPKWDIFGFVGLFTAVNSRTYNNKAQYATTFYTTTRTNQVVSRTPRYGTYSSSHKASNPMFTDTLPAGKHVYYTSEEAATAAQTADYALCYGSADPASFKDLFYFSSQPFDQANYTTATFSRWAVDVSVERADGMPNNVVPTFKWYKASSYTDSNPTLVTSSQTFSSSYNPPKTQTNTAGYAYWYADVYADASDANSGSGRTNVVKVTSYNSNETPTATSTSAGQDEEYPVQYLVGEKANALAVRTASSSQSLIGKYGLESTQLKTTYQWYRSYQGGEAEAIEGATSDSYTPETRLDPGVYTYYCQITYTIDTYAHGLTAVTYTGNSMNFYVEIDTPSAVAGQPEVENTSIANASYDALPDSITPLQVKATVPHGTVGEFTYQWFAKAASEEEDDVAVTEKTAVPEDGVISFDPPESRLGSSIYYCKVSNEVYTDMTGEDRLKTATSANATVTLADTFHVKSAADMATLKAHESQLENGYAIVLDNDIDLSSDEATKTWSAVDLTNNTFDGQGHSITGINATAGYTLYVASSYPYFSNKHDGALFGDIVDSTVKNLTVEGTFNSAGIAGRTVSSTIENCLVKGAVNPDSAERSAAGITVFGLNAKVLNCGNEAAVYTTTASEGSTSGSTGTYVAGGIIAGAHGETTISGCYNAGPVTGFSVSGICADARASANWGQGMTAQLSWYKCTAGNITIENCFNVGTLTSGVQGSGWRSSTPNSYGLAYVRSQNASTGVLVIKNSYNAGVHEVITNTNSKTAANTFGDMISNATASNVTNTYYLDTLKAKTKTRGKSIDADSLAATSMVATLNGDLAEGETGAWKEGALYPVLSWQTSAVPGATDPVIEAAQQPTVTGTKDVAYDPIEAKADYPTGLKDAYKGTLSYQWYEQTAAEDGTVTDTAIAGATSASFTPSASELGKRYYFCRVTNTFTGGSASTDSELYTVWTKTGTEPATPTFDQATVDKSYAYGDELEGLSAKPNNTSAAGMGELSYQWYTRTTAANGTVTDTALRTSTFKGSGITEEVLTPAYDAGTTTYVCKVTNTYEGNTSVGEIVYNVTIGTEVTVSTPQDLLAIAKNAEAGRYYANVSVKLANDIDLSSDEATKNWEPIAQFSGELDGQGHAIKGLNINSDASNLGLIAQINGSASSASVQAGVHDLTVYGSIKATTATANVGGIAGFANGYSSSVVFKNVCADVDVTGGQDVGGLVGEQYQRTNVTFNSCSNWGNLTTAEQASGASTNVGGIVGYLDWVTKGNSTIENCYNRGTITAATMNHNYSGAGGIVGVGRYANVLKNCYNAGTVTALDVDSSAITGPAGPRVGPIYGYLSAAYAAADLANNYYLEGSATVAESGGAAEAYYGVNGTDTTGSALSKASDEELRGADVVTALNGELAEGETGAYKQGSTYPILSWEADEAGTKARVVTNPASFTAYALNASDVADLTVEGAASTTGYQWYRNTTASTEGATAIAGATGTSVKPAVSESGDAYYFCKVSAGDDSVYSQFARVYVATATTAATPTITTQPKDVSCTTASGVVDDLTVAASFSSNVTEGKGELGYQWYKMAGDAPDYGAADQKDTPVEGATEASFTPSTDVTASYYVVVTNTFEYVKTATAISNPAKVTCVNEVVNIESVDDLIALRDSVNAGNTYAGKTVQVKKGTYDLSDPDVWTTTIGRVDWTYNSRTGNVATEIPFSGVFEGNGSTFVLNGYGLFGSVKGGELHDFTVKGDVDKTSETMLTASGSQNIGNAGIVASTIEDATVDGVTVEGTLKNTTVYDNGDNTALAGGIGAIAGKAANVTMRDVSADVAITTTAPSVKRGRYCYVGGIVGMMQGGSIENATVSGSVEASYGDAGGLVGAVAGTDSASIAQAVNSADVTSAGLKGNYSNSGDGAGGIIGATGVGKTTNAAGSSADISSQHVVVSEVANKGKIAGNDNTGGIVGLVRAADTTVDAAYNTGEITYGISTANTAGGLAGSIVTGSTVSNSYNTGVVTPASANVGGLLGAGTAGSVVNCFYSTESYPKDVTGQQGDELSVLQAEDFVSKINPVDAEGKSTGSFVSNPGSTPRLWFEKPYLLGDANVSLAQGELAYTGEALEPAVTVSYSLKGTNVTLEQGTDYEVSYENNVAPGTATVSVEGKGDYTGTVTKEFTVGRGTLKIKANDASKKAGEGDPSFTYEVEGLAAGDELRYVSFTRDKGEDAGTYTVTPQGGAVVRGSSILDDAYNIEYQTGTLTVVDDSGLKSELADAQALVSSLSEADAAALQEAIAKAQGVIDDDQASDAQVKAALEELQTAVKTAQATVNVDISNATVRLSDDAFTYDGTKHEPAVAVTTAEGATLAEGTDYTVAYADNVMPGTATATVTGAGIYKGTLSASFSIERATLTIAADSVAKNASQADPDLTYSVTGLAKTDELRYVTVTRAAGEGAGSYTITPQGGIVVSGNSIVNDAYNIEYQTGTLTIRAAASKAKAANPITVKASTKTVKAKKLKKKKRTVKPLTVTSAQGTVSYKKASGSKKLTINAKTGKVTVKKGTKKGTYKIKVKVSAAGNASYLSATKTVTVKVKVK